MDLQKQLTHTILTDLAAIYARHGRQEEADIINTALGNIPVQQELPLATGQSQAPASHGNVINPFATGQQATTTTGQQATGQQATTATGQQATAATGPQPGDPDVDKVPFDPAVHTGTTTPGGKWRRKRGAGRAGTVKQTPTTGQQTPVTTVTATTDQAPTDTMTTGQAPVVATDTMGFSEFLQHVGNADLTPDGFSNWLRDRHQIEGFELASHPELFKQIVDQLLEEGYLPPLDTGE